MVETKGVALFLEDLKWLCDLYKTTLKIHRGLTVPLDHKMRGSGYFDSVNRELAVAKGRVDWLSILVHESCHMDQWIQDAPSWKADDRYDYGSKLDGWITGKNKDRRSAHRATLGTIKLELDCERRSMVKIAEYNLPINLVTYAQKSNAYILSYHRVFSQRKWLPAVYDNIPLANRMPDKLMADEYYMTPKFEKYFAAAGL